MKIPKNAVKVYSGDIYDFYNYEIKQYDGTTQTFEMLDRLNTVKIIATTKDKFMMAYERQPGRKHTLSLLGGRIEKNEDPLEAAKRELMEESGYESDDWELFATYDEFGKIDWTIYVYIAKNCKQVQSPKLEPGEDIQIKFFEFDAFFDNIISKDFWMKNLTIDFLHIEREGKKEELKQKILG